ncbi:nucleotidyltransferase [Hyperthermus butylicus]|uniref:Conserved crenarchaeal protein n=1 Tax=Hyperthermus butylicus (strain DSM 5456 / JCM 9403 / PLM1-5) TaxID=415426 RepID=A2BMQ9_HYPBU|nr:nucleotidyltransferase [Hyperthermus butylicus]ABM81270.1 conserved crenarchaeal protein [Hyperthermus butylicus DSM 5456]
MAYTLNDLSWLFRKLQEHGIKGVVIGSTVIELALRRKSFEDDVDVFALEPSPLIEEDFYRSVAEREDWQVSYTALGTPKFIVKLPSGEEVIVEFYENIHDFYVPPEILEQAPKKSIGGVEIRVIRPEDYIVLKAKAAREPDIEDLRIIREYIDEGKLKIDERIVKRDIELLPEEEQGFVVNKLRELGFRV